MAWQLQSELVENLKYLIVINLKLLLVSLHSEHNAAVAINGKF